jgi:hypothetical protein
MKKVSTVFLQAVIVLIGLAALAFLLWQPTVEGRNAHTTSLFEIYFKDPLVMCVYLGSIPFFVGLYQLIKMLGFTAHNKVFSPPAVNALRTIKRCALITAAEIIAFITYLGLHARLYPEVGAQDGPEGPIMLGLVTTFVSIVVATAAAVFERLLQKAVDMKSENDLTV